MINKMLCYETTIQNNEIDTYVPHNAYDSCEISLLESFKGDKWLLS